jgi:hypothetical protein
MTNQGSRSVNHQETARPLRRKGRSCKNRRGSRWIILDRKFSLLLFPRVPSAEWCSSAFTLWLRDGTALHGDANFGPLSKASAQEIVMPWIALRLDRAAD